MYNVIINSIAILFLIYLFFRYRWYDMHQDHFLHVMGIFLFCKKRENEFSEYTQTKPFLSILLKFWDWDFHNYVIHQKTWLEANVFFLQLIRKMNSIADLEAKKIRDETI